jgi:hypothetical protein
MQKKSICLAKNTLSWQANDLISEIHGKRVTSEPKYSYFLCWKYFLYI